MISTTFQIITDMLLYVGQSLSHNGVYLFLSIAIAVATTVYINPEKARNYFLKKSGFLIPGSVIVGAITPLCACGTMAVIFSLISSALPWGAVMAFLVSSPLMSPDTFVLLSGFMGMKFAVILAVASIIIGFAAGYFTWLLEKKTSFMNNQLRLANSQKQETEVQSGAGTGCGCTSNNTVNLNQKLELALCCVERPKQNVYPDLNVSMVISYRILQFAQFIRLKAFLKEFYAIGIKKVLPLFAIFAAIAYLVKEYVPTEWIITLFSGQHFYSVPLAALVGIPMYISDATVVPLLQVLKDAGASNGALIAFMIAGPGTSLGVIGGLMMIMKKRAIWLYVSYIFVGSVVLGYLADWVW